MDILDANEFDRMKELKDFDDMRTGVKGLVDAGITKIPNIFVRPANELADDKIDFSLRDVHLPVVDLSQIQSPEKRKAVVDEVKAASSEWGFFRLVNHGVPHGLMEDILEAIREFHEGDPEEKKRLYSRDTARNLVYYSNYSFYHARSLSRRDSFAVMSNMSDPLELPATCREAIWEYRKQMRELGDLLLELLSEALGLKPRHLIEMECGKKHDLVCHYHPPCPEPDRTWGSTQHRDPFFLTVLLQDQVGGLQVLHQDHWVDVKPVPGSFVVNIGDFLQIDYIEQHIQECRAPGASESSGPKSFGSPLHHHGIRPIGEGLRPNQRACVRRKPPFIRRVSTK
ncbi:1-aminocyclopropane-1-carboxylate oxidase homolog 6-like isoform X1 [Rhodamnia argentea]|uniref:1-aminocyclopropane-1-carboxylate oxidase homolog 6-like isoform X1 n=1 Tax=Rhodamnia argentea TaxID=178133 RepID=A0A8B8PGF9_9MYRT|nr:1-aminocyclopropane-1-carboxylate oxidase homolog 6-like isoform X1 [Rhodamnia argentea]